MNNKIGKVFRLSFIQIILQVIYSVESNFIESIKYAVTSTPFNVDQELNCGELINKYGYSSVKYTILTEDGYFLSLYRIPCGKFECKNANETIRKQPLLLGHGFLSSAAQYVFAGKNSPGFLFADAGYDVWLLSFRGSFDSNKHKELDTGLFSSYWDFSWHHMGYYDLPAAIDFIYKIKAQEASAQKNDQYDLLYVGYSMGTTAGFVLLSTRTEYHKKIRACFFLAPVAYMAHTQSELIKIIAKNLRSFQIFATMFLGGKSILPDHFLAKRLLNLVCFATGQQANLCEEVMFLITGPTNLSSFRKELFPTYLYHMSGSTSTMVAIHFLQQIAGSGQFQRYDFGKRKNMKLYGQKKPPLYNVSAITVPILLFEATADWLSTTQDVEDIYRNLPNSRLLYKIPEEMFNHMDYFLHKKAEKLIWYPLIKRMSEYK